MRGLLCLCRLVGFICDCYYRPLPSIPPRFVRGRYRAGARHRASHDGPAQEPRQPRLSLFGPPRLWQNHLRPHPGPLPELRRGPHGHSLRQVPQLRGTRPRRLRLPGRHRDRRRQPRRCGRRPRPPGTGHLRPRPGPLQDLHHRRSPHGHVGRVQRPAQDRRRTAGTHQVHLRHHGAGQGHRHHPFPHAPLPFPLGAAGASHGVSGAALHPGERPRGTRGALARHPRGRRFGPRLPLRARPAHGRRRTKRTGLRTRGRPPGLHARLPAR
ncbi:hypothetical protein SRABI128_05783 [Microbacterium sp. Bi128]|nr:hypothetical protein SRABI128_05783 [Microbacterium sp. Bi128]